jgi:sugar/nucleoside kinase (ribokinase family)
MNEILNMGICAVDGIARTINEYPPPGGLRLFDSLTMTTGGNATNCSIAMGKMGVPCDIMIKIGQDTLGDFILSELKKYGVPTDAVIREEGVSTPFTWVMVHDDGQRSFFHCMGTNGTYCYDDIDMDRVKKAKFLFFTGTMIMRTIDGEQTARLIGEAKAAGVTTLLDTVYTDKSSDEDWHNAIDPCLPNLSYFIPSQPEATKLTGETSPSKMARAFQKLGCENVVIKMDSTGAFCRSAAGEEKLVPAYRIDNVVDTTGAGDCWSSGFLTGLREGQSMFDAADLGNAVAAHVIQHPGASAGIPPLAEIKAFQKSAPRRSS